MASTKRPTSESAISQIRVNFTDFAFADAGQVLGIEGHPKMIYFTLKNFIFPPPSSTICCFNLSEVRVCISEVVVNTGLMSILEITID